MSTTAWIVGTSVAGVVIGATASYLVARPKRLPSVLDEPGVTPGAGTNTDGPWVIRTAHDAGYPWNEFVLHAENWPTPGMFNDLDDTTGDWDPSRGLDAFVRALLGSALGMAGNDPTIANAEGKQPNAALGKSLRTAVRRSLVHPGGWNDRAYGQTNANFAGGVDPGKPCVQGSSGASCNDGVRDPNANAVTYMMNSAGRGLNWLPRHADNLRRLAADLPALRATSTTGARLPGVEGGHQMLVWAPAYDLAKLGPDQPTPTIAFLKWPDGTSTIDPPPSVMVLGIDMSGVEIPALEGA